MSSCRAFVSASRKRKTWVLEALSLGNIVEFVERYSASTSCRQFLAQWFLVLSSTGIWSVQWSWDAKLIFV